MKVFGFHITRNHEISQKQIPAGYQTVEQSRGWYPLVREAFTGAWQRNIVATTEGLLTYAAVYACVTLKASDIAKLRIKLVAQDDEGIWTETDNPAYSPVLAKPNHYQTRNQFLEQWMTSKFIHGNTYVLKQRNDRGGVGRGNVTALYVLDPCRVRVVVTPDGGVYYSLSVDTLSQVAESVIVPASEIIHDVMVPLYHPLCGVSPLSACGLAAMQGLRMQQHATDLSQNGVRPSGILSMPDEIDDEQARDAQKRWEEQFTGNNTGRVAVLGFGMKYQAIAMSMVDAQLIEQLKWSAENVCTAHHVPPYMIGVGTMPTYNNIEALNQQYYAQALQSPIEHLEALLDQGLETGARLGTELDLSGLLRMDSSSRVAAAEKAVKAGLSFNEARREYFDRGSVTGGESPMAQQQMFSIAALAKRDAKADPFGTTPAPKPEPAPAPEPAAKPDDAADAQAKLLILRYKAMAAAQRQIQGAAA